MMREFYIHSCNKFRKQPCELIEEERSRFNAELFKNEPILFTHSPREEAQRELLRFGMSEKETRQIGAEVFQSFNINKEITNLYFDLLNLQLKVREFALWQTEKE